MKKLLVSSAVIALIIPQIALASWWNPIQWFRKQPIQTATQGRSVKTATSTASEIENLQKRIDDLKKQQPVIAHTTITTAKKEKAEKVIPSVGSSEVSKVQIQAQAEADLKAKADEQARIDVVNAMLQKQIAQQDETNRIQSINARIEAEKKARADQAAVVATQQQAEQFAIQQELQVKQEKLNAVNKKIADLNAKYLADLKATRDSTIGRGITTFTYNNMIAAVTRQYDLDYASLTVEYQQIQYGN